MVNEIIDNLHTREQGGVGGRRKKKVRTLRTRSLHGVDNRA